MNWTITISSTAKAGFAYDIDVLGISGYEPTKERLAMIIYQTIIAYAHGPAFVLSEHRQPRDK